MPNWRELNAARTETTVLRDLVAETGASLLGNTPMAAAFARNGWTAFEHAITMSW